jgi:hypothetical protein
VQQEQKMGIYMLVVEEVEIFSLAVVAEEVRIYLLAVVVVLEL